MCSELNDKYFRPKSTLLLVVAILNTGDAFSADDNMPFGLAPSVDSITPPSARQNKFDVQRMFMMFINLELRICCDYEIGGTNARFVCLFELHFFFFFFNAKERSWLHAFCYCYQHTNIING